MAGPVHLVDYSGATRIHRSRLGAWLNRGIFVGLSAVALLAPLSTKGAVNAFRVATFLWLFSLVSGRRRPRRQPLAAPLILFLLLTGVSSLLSVDPFLSWGRMRTVTLLFLAVVTGQALDSRRQIKTLCALLIGSSLITVLYTGWQYSAGIGVQVSGTAEAIANVKRLGIAQGDIVRKVGDIRIRSPRDISVAKSPSDHTEVLIWRETPNALQPFRLHVDLQAFQSALQSAGLKLSRAHPPRAQGFFKHYFPYSEILVFVGMLLWGFAIAGVPNRKFHILLFAAFAATALGLTLTLTRISLVSLIAGAFLIILLRASSRNGWISLLAVALIACVAILWVQQRRGSPQSDPGTVYRLLMWKDSISLIRAHPAFGVGLDSIAGDWQRWNLEAYRRFGLHSHFHSTPVQLAVECGLPALAVWIWFLAAYVAFLVREYQLLASSDWFSRGLFLGAGGTLAGFVLTGFLQYNLGDAEAMVVFWLITGLTLASARMRNRFADPPRLAPAEP